MAFEVLLTPAAAEFIEGTPIKMRAKIFRTIELLKTFGYELVEPHSKKINGIDHLRELRVKLGRDICRLFYFHHHGLTYVITSGYVKKEMKTKPGEIEKALTIMAAIRRNEK